MYTASVSVYIVNLVALRRILLMVVSNRLPSPITLRRLSVNFERLVIQGSSMYTLGGMYIVNLEG